MLTEQLMLEQLKAKELMIERLKAIFLLAGIELLSFHQLPNNYCGDNCCPHRPWGLAETKYGLIKIGWRKRVISIEWPKEANINGKDILPKGEEWITSWESGIHAYGWAKAVEYLTVFVQLAERAIRNKEEDSRLTAPEVEEYKILLKAVQEAKGSMLDKDKEDRFAALRLKREPPKQPLKG